MPSPTRFCAFACAALLAACAGETEGDPASGEEAESTEEAVTSSSSLDAAVKLLETNVHKRAPGTYLSITVKDFKTGEYADYRGGTKHVSASSAKAIWVAAALDAVADARVEPYADAIFKYSDNSAAGRVIDLVGPNAENRFYDKAGMHDSGFIEWDFDRVRQSTNRPRPLGSDNYFTSHDAVRFLTRLYDHDLLSDVSRTRLLDWMKESPNSGVGGWLGARLPAEAARTMRHKAGWLPPPYSDEQLNEIGIINADPDGNHRYAIAIFTRHGNSYWGQQAPFVEYASCVIYRAIAKRPHLKCSG